MARRRLSFYWYFNSTFVSMLSKKRALALRFDLITYLLSGAIFRNSTLISYYSDLRAITGGRRAARSAGYNPAPNPTEVARISAKIASSGLITNNCPPIFEVSNGRKLAILG